MRNNLVKRGILFAAVVFMGVWAGPAGAEDFFDLIDYNVSGTGVEKSVSPTIYSAKLSAGWNDTNLDGKWDDTEFMRGPLQIYDRKGNLALQTPPGVTSRAQLETWAEDNADAILNVIFPGGIATAMGISDDAIMSQGMFSGRILKTAVPASKRDQIEKLNNDFKGALEYHVLEVNSNDGQAGSLMLGYTHTAESDLEFGFLLPYRYMSVDDEIDSSSHFLGLDLYTKYPVIKGRTVTWNIGADIMGDVYNLQSDMIDQSGNYKYGGGVFTSVEMLFGFGGCLNLGLDYKITKASLDSGMLDTDNEFVEEAIDWLNDLDPVQTLSYGFNFGLPIGDSFSVNMEVIRSNFISDDIDSDRSAQTYTGLSASYFPSEAFEFNLGINKTFELDEIEATGITIGTIYRY
ncbi:MAG: hypothetical protein ACOZF0_04295 [Thermodesulfobacteriota bacterium]